MSACVCVGPLYAGLTCHDTSWKCEECWDGNTPVRCIRFPPPVVVAPIVKRCCTGLVASDYRFPQPDCGIWSTISGNMRLLRPSLFLCSKLLLDNSKRHTHTPAPCLTGALAPPWSTASTPTRSTSTFRMPLLWCGGLRTATWRRCRTPAAPSTPPGAPTIFSTWWPSTCSARSCQDRLSKVRGATRF